jgi:hypothetical protein
MSDKTHMHGDGESYSGVVPAKQPNKSGEPPAEAVEGRPLTKENMDQPNQYRTQNRKSWSSKLVHVREAARKDKKLKFTALLHHVTVGSAIVFIIEDIPLDFGLCLFCFCPGPRFRDGLLHVVSSQSELYDPNTLALWPFSLYALSVVTFPDCHSFFSFRRVAAIFK